VIRDLHTLLNDCTDLIEEALTELGAWTAPGRRASQFECDVVADSVATEYLEANGCGVFSEESVPTRLDRDVVVVLDPIDGTANAVRGLPWYGPSLCALVRGRPTVAHVRNLATGERFDAEAGAGATVNGVAARPAAPRPLSTAIVGVSGPAPSDLVARGRAMAAVALSLCAVAAGALDGFVDFDIDHHRCWDHLAGALVCTEAGALAQDVRGRDLADLHQGRTLVAASHPDLLQELLARRATTSVD
jgi:myo-inositol-1(or 4)-monophosphatase